MSGCGNELIVCKWWVHTMVTFSYAHVLASIHIHPRSRWVDQPQVSQDVALLVDVVHGLHPAGGSEVMPQQAHRRQRPGAHNHWPSLTRCFCGEGPTSNEKRKCLP
jgi:hypothetical protein